MIHVTFYLDEIEGKIESVLRRCNLVEVPAVGERIRFEDGGVQYEVLNRSWFVGENKLTSEGQLRSPLHAYVRVSSQRREKS